MAYHEAMAYFRRTPGLEDSVPIEDKAVVEDGNDILAERELKTRIKGIVDRLPIRCRSVFMLSRYDGKSYKEIAELMDISVKTVENQMVKAVKVLRSELQDYLVAVIVMIIIAIFFH